MTLTEKKTPSFGVNDQVYILDKEIYDTPTWIQGVVEEVGDETILVKWDDLEDPTEYELSDLPDIRFKILPSESVLIFISLIRDSFIGADQVYTLGSCYQFYRILKFVFPHANAYYNSDHVITEIDGKYYDITGDVEKTNHLLMDKHYPESAVMQNRFSVIAPSLPQSSTEEEKDLIEKLKYVDHVLSDDGYQSESEIRSIVKDVMNYFKTNL